MIQVPGGIAGSEDEDLKAWAMRDQGRQGAEAARQDTNQSCKVRVESTVQVRPCCTCFWTDKLLAKPSIWIRSSVFMRLLASCSPPPPRPATIIDTEYMVNDMQWVMV